MIDFTDELKRDRGREIAHILCNYIWSLRYELATEYVDPEEAVRKAVQMDTKGPIVISDGPDNPGGGSYADGTHLLRALLDVKAAPSLVALLYDPAAVDICAAAGVGANVALTLGGKCAPAMLGKPVECVAKVLKITDGRYKNRGPMNPGLQMDLLGTALIDVDGVRVIVVKNPTQPYDFGLLELHGIDPSKEKIIVVKPAVHFRAAYGLISKEMLQVSYRGICAQRPQDVLFSRCKRPIFPIDDNTVFL